MSTLHPNLSRAARRLVERPSAAESATGADEPSAAELAEALLCATQGLKTAGRQCGEEADPMLRAISLPRGRVLMAMAEAGNGRVRMGDLSETLGVTARNITTIVDGLEREGLIARRPDPTDRRAILVELTRKAHGYIARVHALHCAIAERFFAPLDGAERGELLRLLAKTASGGEGLDHE
ncbi:MAG TPA: MarR family transcriptional regulator [Ktedonobacterales bacterium]|jgi:DNA-binding MarR family transcriptional regulator